MLSLLHLEGGTCTLMETELHSFWLYDLPEDLSPLSINGSHLHKGRIDLPAQRAQDLLDGLDRAEHDTVLHVDQTPAPHGLEHLRIEQLGQRQPTGLGCRALGLATCRLDPLAIVGQQSCHVFLESIREKQWYTVRSQHLVVYPKSADNSISAKTG